jgi:hypothetical protein
MSPIQISYYRQYLICSIVIIIGNKKWQKAKKKGQGRMGRFREKARKKGEKRG